MQKYRSRNMCPIYQYHLVMEDVILHLIGIMDLRDFFNSPVRLLVMCGINLDYCVKLYDVNVPYE